MHNTSQDLDFPKSTTYNEQRTTYNLLLTTYYL